VLKDRKPFLVTGSPGGSRIPTAVLQVIVNVIDHRLNIAEAVAAPRIHHQWLPDTVYVEPNGLSPDTLKLLAGMGYHLDVAGEGKVWGQAAGILVGGESLGEIAKGGGARYNGAIDSRAAAGEAIGY
jgi:gamma-glutamyltranspeptidase/glutathione hydrolase